MHVNLKANYQWHKEKWWWERAVLSSKYIKDGAEVWEKHLI